jgi:hypothetical protein
MSSVFLKGACATALTAGALLATATTASAEVACNRYGECWRVYEHYTYPPNMGIVFHGDDWRFHHMHHWHWRADRDRDDDRGYYRNGVWIGF